MLRVGGPGPDGARPQRPQHMITRAAMPQQSGKYAYYYLFDN